MRTHRRRCPAVKPGQLLSKLQVRHPFPANNSQQATNDDCGLLIVSAALDSKKLPRQREEAHASLPHEVNDATRWLHINCHAISAEHTRGNEPNARIHCAEPLPSQVAMFRHEAQAGGIRRSRRGEGAALSLPSQAKNSHMHPSSRPICRPASRAQERLNHQGFLKPCFRCVALRAP